MLAVLQKTLVFLHSIALLHGLWSPQRPDMRFTFFKSVLLDQAILWRWAANPDFTFISDAIAANLAAATVPAAMVSNLTLAVAAV